MAATSGSEILSRNHSKPKLSDGSTLSANSNSDSDSDPDSDSDGDSSAGTSSSSGSDTSASDSDSELGEVSQEYLDSLLEKAKAGLRAKAQAQGKQKAVSGEEDEIRLDDEQKSTEELPRLDPGKLPPGYFDFTNEDPRKTPALRDIDAERLASASGSSSVPTAPPEPPEHAKDGRRLTKKERKALKNKTTGASWFDLPAPDPADLPRLYREVEALRLRNSLDPKRFYRKEPGEGKGIKGLPEHFAIGTILPTSTPFGTTSGDNLPRAERKRTIVDELVDDAEAKRYAKRKFEDLQTVRGARGRGTFKKRFASRKPKW